MDKTTLDLAAYAASGMTPEEYRKTGGYRNVVSSATAELGNALVKYAEFEKKQQEATNQKIAGYMQSLNSEVDITSLTESQQSAVTQFLVEQKRAYANAAMNIVKFDPTDEQYMEYISVMNGVNNKVKNLAGQIDTYNEQKLKFVQDVNSGAISDGNDIGEFALTSDALTNNASLLVDTSGNLAFANEAGEITKYNELPNYFNKDFKTANSLTKLMDTVYSKGQSVDASMERMLRMQLSNMISQGGRSTLLSIANDDFFVEGGLGIIDPTLYEKGNEKDLKERVIDGYIQALKDTAAEGAKRNTKNNNVKGGRLTAGQQKLQQMQNLIVNNQDVIINGINALAGKEEIEFIDLYNLGTELGLDVNKVESDGDVIGYQFEHPLVKLPVSISLQQLNNPKSVSTILLRSLGTDYLGLNPNELISFETPQTEETESDLPIIE